MCAKLKKFEEQLNLYLPFKASTFFAYVFSSSVVCALSILIVLKIPQIGLTGVILLAIVYLLPSFIAYDVCSLYNDTYNVPKLLHPKRRLILFLNLFLGLTVIGWLAALALSIGPGSVCVNSIKYIEIVSSD